MPPWRATLSPWTISRCTVVGELIVSLLKLRVDQLEITHGIGVPMFRALLFVLLSVSSVSNAALIIPNETAEFKFYKEGPVSSYAELSVLFTEYDFQSARFSIDFFNASGDLVTSWGEYTLNSSGVGITTWISVPVQEIFIDSIKISLSSGVMLFQEVGLCAGACSNARDFTFGVSVSEPSPLYLALLALLPLLRRKLC